MNSMQTLKKIKQQLSALHNDYKVAQKQLKEESKEAKQKEQEYQDVQEALSILQTVAKTIQQQAHKKITELVTICLQFVFGSRYSFGIIFHKKRNKTEAQLVFLKDDMEINPLEEAGGGVIDVASFALRLASLLLSRPKKAKLLILDEPFKHLSREYTKRIRMLLEKMSQEHNVQIILVTHDRLLKIGKIITVEEK